MRIRRAESGDFEAATALLEELGRPRVGPAEREACLAVWERHMADEDAAHLVAEDEESGEIVGFCSLHFRERLNVPRPQAWVPDLIVTEAARREGVGRALIDEAMRIARERGCFGLTLESGYQRAEAHHLYRQAGMRDSGKFFEVRFPAGGGPRRAG